MTTDWETLQGNSHSKAIDWEMLDGKCVVQTDGLLYSARTVPSMEQWEL